MPSQQIVNAIKHVNLLDINVVTLTKLIRDNTRKPNGLTISQALMVAYALKEAYRLGEIRGRALR